MPGYSSYEYSTRVLSGTAAPVNLLLVRLLIYYRIYMRVPVKPALVPGTTSQLATGPTRTGQPVNLLLVRLLIYYRIYMRVPVTPALVPPVNLLPVLRGPVMA